MISKGFGFLTTRPDRVVCLKNLLCLVNFQQIYNLQLSLMISKGFGFLMTCLDKVVLSKQFVMFSQFSTDFTTYNQVS